MLHFLPDAGSHQKLSSQPSNVPLDQARDGRSRTESPFSTPPQHPDADEQSTNPNSQTSPEVSFTELIDGLTPIENQSSSGSAQPDSHIPDFPISPDPRASDVATSHDAGSAPDRSWPLDQEATAPIQLQDIIDESALGEKAPIQPIAETSEIGALQNPSTRWVATEHSGGVTPKPVTVPIAEIPSVAADGKPVSLPIAELPADGAGSGPKPEITPIADAPDLLVTGESPSSPKTPLQIIAEPNPALEGRAGEAAPTRTVNFETIPTTIEGFTTLDVRELWLSDSMSRLTPRPQSTVDLPHSPTTPHAPEQAVTATQEPILKPLIQAIAEVDPALSPAPTSVAATSVEPTAVSGNTSANSSINVTTLPGAIETASVSTRAPQEGIPLHDPVNFRGDLNAVADLNAASDLEPSTPTPTLRDANLTQAAANGAASTSVLNTGPEAPSAPSVSLPAVPMPIPAPTLSQGAVAFGQTGTAIAVFTPPPATLEQLPQSIVAVALTGKRASIQIDPPELGRIQIEYSFDANQRTRVTLIPETEAARAAIAERLPTLASLFETHTTDTVDIELASSDSFDQGASFDQAAGGFSGGSSNNAHDAQAADTASSHAGRDAAALTAAQLATRLDGRNGNRLHLRI